MQYNKNYFNKNGIQIGWEIRKKMLEYVNIYMKIVFNKNDHIELYEKVSKKLKCY